jgi:hypothetical protein
LNLEDEGASTASPANLLAATRKHALTDDRGQLRLVNTWDKEDNIRRVDGQLREGSGNRGEDDEESHFGMKVRGAKTVANGE